MNLTKRLVKCSPRFSNIHHLNHRYFCQKVEILEERGFEELIEEQEAAQEKQIENEKTEKKPLIRRFFSLFALKPKFFWIFQNLKVAKDEDLVNLFARYQVFFLREFFFSCNREGFFSKVA